MNTETKKPDTPKRKRGRPRIYTDTQRIERAKEATKRSKQKCDASTIAIRRGVLNTLHTFKEAEGKRLGIPLTNHQFFLLLFKNWKENHKS